jgi:hypothetical protein
VDGVLGSIEPMLASTSMACLPVYNEIDKSCILSKKDRGGGGGRFGPWVGVAVKACAKLVPAWCM